MPNITLSLEITDRLCKDLLTAAVEGGSAYWLACHSVKREESLDVIKIIKPFDRDDPDVRWADVTLETVRDGIQRILEGNLVNSTIQGDVLRAVTDPDSCSWDAETADCVLQAGMFNEVVYG
jgi:hypothetical protein